jgi:hypothetical protein
VFTGSESSFLAATEEHGKPSRERERERRIERESARRERKVVRKDSEKGE